MNTNDALSSGLRPLPTEISRFASTQAAWRFYKNGSVTLKKLQAPLQQVAQEKTVSHCKDYTLMVHDWSRLTLANTRASWINTQSAIKPMLVTTCKAHC